MNTPPSMPQWRSGELVRPSAFSAEVMARVAAFVQRRAGLTFDAARRPQLEAGVWGEMGRAGIRDPEVYLDRLEGDPALVDALLAEITIGETYFFRDDDQFALLRERILPELLQRRPADRPLRIWSAGCATGEEPYSLAMVLHEFGQLASATILGTDVSRPALQRARQARYSSWSLRGVAPEVVARYFTRVGDRVALCADIRNAVEFRYLNLAGGGYPSVPSGICEMDLVLCRNVLIYLAPDRVAEIAGRMLDSLAEGGWLMLGSTDPLLTGIAGARAEITSAGLIYRRQSSAPPRESWLSIAPAPVRGPTAAAIPPVVVPPSAASFPSHRTEGAGADEVGEAARRSYAAGNYRQAAAEARTALAHRADSVEIWVLLINALVNDRALEEAAQACRAARGHHAASAEVAALHAFVLVELGQQREAETMARQAVYLDPALPIAHLALGATLMLRRDALGAQRAFRFAERLAAAPQSGRERADEGGGVDS